VGIKGNVRSPEQSRVWRSSDGGSSWSLLNDANGRLTPGTSQDEGGDSDIAVDAAGRVYQIDMGDRVHLFTSEDRGATWTTRASPGGDVFHDRPWVDAGRAGHAVFSWLGPGFAQTFDGGLTFTDRIYPAQSPRIEVSGNIALAPDGQTVYIPYVANSLETAGPARMHVLVSRDLGESWDDLEVSGPLWHKPSLFEPATAIFPSLAVDTAGNAFLAWSEYTEAFGTRVQMVVGSSQGRAWTEPICVSCSGLPIPWNAIMPWVAAGSDGKVAVVYLASAAPADPGHSPGPWFVEVAASFDRGASWERIQAAPDPVHEGTACTGGTACLFGGSPRSRILELLSVAVTPEGRLILAYPDDSATHREGLPAQIQFRFVAQATGPSFR
jgi:hypothetical protein